MTEPSAEAREQARQIVQRWEAAQVGCFPGLVFNMYVGDIARALAEKDAALAEARLKRDDWQAAHNTIAESYNRLEADLAATKKAFSELVDELRQGAQALYRQKAILACDRDWLLGKVASADTALSSPSPGAAWLATAREVVEALNSTGWKNLDGACWCRGPAISGSAPHVHQSVCMNVRALLARVPEGMR